MSPLTHLTAPLGNIPVMGTPASAVKATARLVSPLRAFIRNQDQTFSSKSFQLNPIPRPRRMPQLRLGFTLPRRSLSSSLPGYVSVHVPNLFVSCISKASVLPLASHSQEAGKEPLVEQLHLRLPIVPTPETSYPILVNNKSRIFLPARAEKKL